MVILPVLLLPSLILACNPDPTPQTTTTLDAARLLVRASLDLRGTRPSPTDLSAVTADPTLLDTLIDGYLGDPAFGDRVAMIYADALQIRADYADLSDEHYTFDDTPALLTALGEEPIELIRAIASDDLPWTTVTTADWTMVNPALATWYPVDASPTDDPGGDQWRAAAWTDGRPAAGLLSTNGLYWRYSSTDLNANRGRFNAVSRALLCTDYLRRAVAAPADLDLTDEDAVREAIVTVDSCIVCHDFIDPAGAFMWGFQRFDPYAIEDLSSYHPQDEWLWEDTNSSPAYAGVPGSDLTDLGWMMADDPRLLSCAVQQAVGALWGREPELSDTARIDQLRSRFIDGGLALRPLYRAIVDSPEYRASPGQESAVDWRIATADLLMSQVAGLTGYRPTTDQVDLWRTDISGLRSLAGAGRSLAARYPSVASPAAAVVQARLAEAAAGWVTGDGRATPQATALFAGVDLDDPDPPQLESTLIHLWLAVLSRVVSADDADLVATTELWRGLQTDGATPAQAWAGVLTALLRHPDLLVY